MTVSARRLRKCVCWTAGAALAGAAAWPVLAQQPVAGRSAMNPSAMNQSMANRSAVGQSTMATAAMAAQRQTTTVPPAAPYLTLDNVSPYYQEPILPRKLKLHDVVTVVVKENSNYLAEGSVDRRKNGLYEAVLKDWVKLASGLTLKPAEQADGDPKASGTIQQTYRSDSELELRSRIEFRIAASVVDIRPNGNLVLEAHNTFRQDNEIVDASLSGIIRPEDVLPDNTVLSEDIVELNVYKRSKGHVRDGYRRGWMTRVIDVINPF